MCYYHLDTRTSEGALKVYSNLKLGQLDVESSVLTIGLVQCLHNWDLIQPYTYWSKII